MPPVSTSYISPITNTALVDPRGDINLLSSDGYDWRMRSQVLRAASDVFDDMISNPTTANTPITLPHPAKDIHAFLHFITKQTFEGQKELAGKLPKDGVAPTPQMTADAQRQVDQIAAVVTLLDKFQCTNHIEAARVHALALVGVLSGTRMTLKRQHDDEHGPNGGNGGDGRPRDRNRGNGNGNGNRPQPHNRVPRVTPDIPINDADFLVVAFKHNWADVIKLWGTRDGIDWSDGNQHSLFKKACNAQKLNLAKGALRSMSSYTFNSESRQGKNLHAGNWCQESAASLGYKYFFAFLDACQPFPAEGPVDWNVVADRFTFDEPV